MKQKSRLSIVALICGLSLMVSCLPSRKASLFREMKNAADTLVVIGPYLEIMAYDFREKTPDSVLAEKNKELITRITNQILSSRYVLKHIEMPELDRDKLLALYYDADNSSGANKTIRQQTFFPELKGAADNQLAIFITYHAEYNSITTAVATSPFSNSWSITPSARSRSDFRLIVFNIQTDEIIFYNRYNTRNINPNSTPDMERMIRKLIRDIYYK